MIYMLIWRLILAFHVLGTIYAMSAHSWYILFNLAGIAFCAWHVYYDHIDSYEIPYYFRVKHRILYFLLYFKIQH